MFSSAASWSARRNLSGVSSGAGKSPAGLEAPRTWDEYLEVAATFHAQDLNGDGDPDYGSCISKVRAQQAYWFIHSIASSMIQSQGTSQGVFFDTETMEPLVNNEAFGRALEIFNETTQYGPPDELNLNVGDTRGLFTSGRCALSIDWHICLAKVKR